MSTLVVLENIIFWTLIIIIAFMARDTPAAVFTILSYILLYFLIKRLLMGGSNMIAYFSINLVILFFLTFYFFTGITPLAMVQGLIKNIMMIPKLMK